MSPYEYLEHTADIGIGVTGSTLAEVFASAGDGLAALICDPDTVRERDSRVLAAQAPDAESLLVAWLGEIIFQGEAGRFTFKRFQVKTVAETHVQGTGHGEASDPSRHRFGIGVKAVTYHGLAIEMSDQGYRAQVILDV